MSSARSGACRNATRRRPSGRCRLRARVGRARRWRRDAARPRERRRRPYGVVIDLIHVAEYVCKAVPVFHRHWRHRRGVRYLVRDRMEFTGARRCYTVPLFHPCAGPDPPGGQLGWSRGGSEAPGATKPAATSNRTGTSTTREYQRNHAQRYADGIARPVSKPPRRPPHHAFDRSSSSCRAARMKPLGPSTKKSRTRRGINRLLATCCA